MKEHVRDTLVCLSLANVLWLEAWRFAFAGLWNPFFFPLRAHTHIVALVLAVLLTAMALRVGLALVRADDRLRAIGSWLFLLLFGVAVNTIRIQFPALATAGGAGVAGGLAVATVLLMGVAWSGASRRDIVRWLKRATLLMGPLCLWTFSQAGYAAIAESRVPKAIPSEHLVQPSPGPKVVVVLFDELDRDTSSLGQPGAIGMLPSLSRLADEAIDFRAAVAPVGARTMLSVPSITTGRTAVASDVAGPGDVRLRFADGEETLWTKTPNMFRIARAEGVDAFLAGWFFPYCRLFGADLSNCSWRSAYPERPVSFAESLKTYAPLFWKSVPGLYRLSLGAGWRRPSADDLEWHQQSYREVHQRALQGVTDSRYRLVFLHYPVPHLSPDFRGNYLENQILADRALGELRRSMEEAGVWDSSAVIVLSDHGYRALPGERHPLLLIKPPYQGRVSTEVHRRVKLVRVFQLVLGLLRGRVQTAKDVVAVVEATD